MTAKYKCPECGFPVPLSERDLPFNCHCGAVYFFLDELLPGAHESPLRRGQPVRKTQGPGTEFETLAAEIGVTMTKNCTCAQLKNSMNRLGVAGCQRHRATLAAAVKKNYATMSWTAAIRAGWKAVWLVNPLDPFGSLVDEAVRRAEIKDKERIQMMVEELLKTEPRDSAWRTRPDVIEAERALLDIAASKQYIAPEVFVGRGIVTLGGSAKYFGAAFVLVSLLRKLGCQLPVEWWYLGKEEMDPTMIALAESLGNVQCVDMLERLAQFGRVPRRIGGWEAKPWAIMYSKFSEVLFLDADNVPAVDPTYLFDTPEYKEAGTVAWPDFPPAGWSISEIAFNIARLPIPGKTTKPDWRAPTDYRPWETGQLLVDKARAWQALEIWATLADQSDFYYPHEYRGNGYWHVYGDKDTAYLAWERTKTPYAMPQDCMFYGGKNAGAFIQHDFLGDVVFQHRVQPVVKWVLHGENKEAPGTLHHQTCVDTLKTLAGNWPGHVWDQEDETEEERREVERHMGDAFWFNDSTPRRITFDITRAFPDGLRWTVRKINGGWFLFIYTADRAIAVFDRDNYGNWCNHGTSQFISPAPPADFELPTEKDEIGIWNDIVNINEYRLPELFNPQDVIIDIGGHCGIFAWACLARGAGRVVSVEPAPENYARLCHNLIRFGSRSSRVPAAAWSEAGELQIEQKDGARHTGGWSAMGTVSGVRVAAVSFEQLVESAASYSGRNIRLVKLDCEGSEWTLLKSFKRWDLVDAWCAEYHNTKHAEAERYLRSTLEPQGYVVEVVPHPQAEQLGHFFAHRG